MRIRDLQTITPRRTSEKLSAKFRLAFMLFSALWIGLAACLSTGLGGCGGAKERGTTSPNDARLADMNAEGRAVFGSSPRATGGGAARDGAWTILLTTVPASQDDLGVMRTVAQVRERAGLPEARLERRGRATVVAYGAYPGPTDPKAQSDLARIRAIVVDGARPYETAMLVPPEFEGVQGARPEWDLGGVKARMGRDAIYTLQVAVYRRGDDKEPTPQDLVEIRAAAEKAAEALRGEGAEAYYWHGRRQSMVTVGVFGPKDHDVLKPGQDSPVLRLTREQHPFNLVNGRQYLVRMRGQEKATPQRSFLVAIPD